MKKDKTYPGTSVLINLAGIKDWDKLRQFENICVAARLSDPDSFPIGNFDVDHLKAIHKFLFQDVYEWAGEFREVAISKNDCVFALPQFLDKAAKDALSGIDMDSLSKLKKADFATALTTIVNDVNAIHPFREGNGRTIREFAGALSKEVGFELKLKSMRNSRWVEACYKGFHGDTKPMEKLLKSSLALEQSRDMGMGM